MFWDKVSPIYDIIENLYNGRVYKGTGEAVACFLEASDNVLECACGTGAISKAIAKKCKTLIATDFSDGMLRRASKKLKNCENVTTARANIMDLDYRDGQFDKVVAGNVIHLLAEPEKALRELERVVKTGGMIIIPTYINRAKKGSEKAAKLFERFGADFKRQFDLDSYRSFLSELGCVDVRYSVVEGRMPCAIAVITKA